MKYHNISVTVDAFQVPKHFVNTDKNVWPEWVFELFKSGTLYFRDQNVYVRTTEGGRTVYPNDFIFFLKGNIQVCSEQTFFTTHEEVPSDD